MNDLIKRSDAIKAIEELPNAYNGWSDTYDKAYIIGALEEVPSADIPHSDDWERYSDKLWKIAYERGKREALKQTEPQKKEVEWVYNKRERLWYPYSNGELLFKTEPNCSEKPNNCEPQTDCAWK